MWHLGLFQRLFPNRLAFAKTYKVDLADKQITIHYVRHRRDVYREL
jgi:hypothetical protein